MRLACALMVVMLPIPASGQPRSDERRREGLLEQAQRASAAGDNVRALSLAQQAAAIRSTPSLRSAIAEFERGLGQTLPALTDARLCVRELDADRAARNWQQIMERCQAIVTAFEPRVGRLSLRLPDVPGLRVSVDGVEITQSGREATHEALPGRVTVEARAPGRLRFYDSVLVSAGQVRQLTITLSEPPVSGPGASGATTIAAPIASGATAATAEAPTPGLGWLWIVLGGGLSSRVWRIPILGEMTPRGYENNAFGELRGTLAAYYRINRNRLGIGVEGSVGVPLGIESQGRGVDGRVVPIATSAVEVQVGAALALRPWSGGLLRAFVGLVHRSFSMDTTALSPEMRLAPAAYTGLRVAGEGTVPLYARRDWEFGVIIGGEICLTEINLEMKEAFGANAETSIGVGVWGGLSLRLDGATPGLGLRLTAESVSYATDFQGPARIGTPAESIDWYSRVVLAVSYAAGSGGSFVR